MKLTNSILRDYNIDNSPKNYLKIEFYRIKLGKKRISRNIRSIENTKKIKKPSYWDSWKYAKSFGIKNELYYK